MSGSPESARLALMQTAFGTVAPALRFVGVPRFYFHLFNDMDVPDLEGIELSDLSTARTKAIEQARGMIGEVAKTEARIVLSHHIDIEDEEGRLLDRIVFRDIITVED
jgi:hypothetical protein